MDKWQIAIVQFRRMDVKAMPAADLNRLETKYTQLWLEGLVNYASMSCNEDGCTQDELDRFGIKLILIAQALGEVRDVMFERIVLTVGKK